MREKEHRAVFKRNVGRMLPALLVCVAFGAVIMGCEVVGSVNSPLEGYRITKFMIGEVEGVIDQNKRTIEVVLPFGADVEKLVPTVEFVGAKIDPDPAPEETIDFTDPVKYTVFSKDGSAFVYTVTVVFEIPSTDADLSSLAVDGHDLFPLFDRDITEYTLTALSEPIQITAMVNDMKSRLIHLENSAALTSGAVFSSQNLIEGENSVTVQVTAEDGITTKSYTLTVKFSDFIPGTVIKDIFKVSNMTEWNSAVTAIKNGGNNQNYVINATADFNISASSTANFGSVTGVTVVISGSQQIGLSNTGTLLRVGANQKIILRDVTLKGRTDNTTAVVSAGLSADFEMRGGAKITGNKASVGGGVSITDGGTFNMRDNSSVFGNISAVGGGVGVTDGAVFTMWDNTSVSGNTANNDGGGVRVNGKEGRFTMRDNASVSGNTAKDNGGGVWTTGTVIMRDNATVSGNTANSGGGAYVYSTGGYLTMRDNVSVSGNTASLGGGVCSLNAFFHMAGGTVYGSGGTANDLKNTASSGSALSASGSGTVEYGTGGTDGEAWVSKATLNTTDSTIKVVNGVKQ